MPPAEVFRRLVEIRAGSSCEYCRLLQAAAGVTFHLEHFVPTSQSGKTTLSNLVLSCPGCNLAKGERTFGLDQSGHRQRLFNPRAFDPWILGWHLHFILDRKTGLIIPRTQVGEATVMT